MSVDLSEFETPKGCSLARMELSDEQRAKLDAAIARPDIMSPTIVRVLRTWGFETSKDTVNRHRKGECQCRKP